MNAKPVPSDRLPQGSIERAVARIAYRAMLDTIHGGAMALVMANRAESIGLPNADELAEAVSDAYSRSTGRHSERFQAWECGECGSVHLGKSGADQCCMPTEEELEDCWDSKIANEL